MEPVTLLAGLRGPVLRPGIAVRRGRVDLRSGRLAVPIGRVHASRLVRGDRLVAPARMVAIEPARHLIVRAAVDFRGVLIHVAVRGEALVARGPAAVVARGELVQLHPGARIEYHREPGEPWVLVHHGTRILIDGVIGLEDARPSRIGDWHPDDLRLWAAQAAEGERLPSHRLPGLSWRADHGLAVPVASGTPLCT
jgi:hypothetical protein